MIAIDTNVLLRHMLDDDTLQSKKAHALIRNKASVLVTDVVLAETLWTLNGKKYNASRDDIVVVVNGLLAEPSVVFENRQVVWAALNDFIEAKSVKVGGRNKSVDFADALIARKSQTVANQNGHALTAFYTFDQAALVLPLATEP